MLGQSIQREDLNRCNALNLPHVLICKLSGYTDRSGNSKSSGESGSDKSSGNSGGKKSNRSGSVQSGTASEHMTLNIKVSLAQRRQQSTEKEHSGPALTASVVGVLTRLQRCKTSSSRASSVRRLPRHILDPKHCTAAQPDHNVVGLTSESCAVPGSVTVPVSQ